MLDQRLHLQQARVNEHKRYLITSIYNHMVLVRAGGFLCLFFIGWMVKKRHFKFDFLLKTTEFLLLYVVRSLMTRR